MILINYKLKLKNCPISKTSLSINILVLYEYFNFWVVLFINLYKSEVNGKSYLNLSYD